MALLIKWRCPVCGSSRDGKHFGLSDDGEHDPEVHPAHVIERIVMDFGGRGHAVVLERGDLGMNHAIGLRAALQTALDRLDAEINGAAGDGDDNDDPEDDVDYSAEDDE